MPDIAAMAEPTEEDISAIMAGPTTSLAQTIGDWVETRLFQPGYPKLACKRLALLVTGLLMAPTASRGALATGLTGRHLSPAKPESIARRLARLLDDLDLDPPRVLHDIYGNGELARLLQGEIAAHAANRATPPLQHQRFRPRHVVVDLTT